MARQTAGAGAVLRPVSRPLPGGRGSEPGDASLAREGDGSDDEFSQIALASSRASSLPQVCVQCIQCVQPHRCNTNCPTKRTACSSLDTGMKGQARFCGSEPGDASLAREGDCSSDEFLRIAPASSRASSLPQVCVQCIQCVQPHRCNTNCPTKRTACSLLSCSLMPVCRVRRARPRRW